MRIGRGELIAGVMTSGLPFATYLCDAGILSGPSSHPSDPGEVFGEVFRFKL